MHGFHFELYFVEVLQVYNNCNTVQNGVDVVALCSQWAKQKTKRLILQSLSF